MRGINKFLVKPVQGKRYDNTAKYGDVEIVVSSSEEDHIASNRFAEVIELPLGYEGNIKIGDILIVHHNIFKYYYDVKQQRRSYSAYLKDDLFFVGFEQFFLYGSNDNWKCHDKFCFVKPIPQKDNPSSYHKCIGEMKYVNDKMESYGVKQGDRVFLSPECEYIFKIDNEILWRVYDHLITGIA